MYNLEQLRMFVETADLGSFSACARKLGKVQSAVSQGIANLEIDFDVVLFDRRTRKPGLTPEGERLLPYARVLLQQAHELNTAASSIGRDEESLIRLAIDETLLQTNFSQILQAFGERFPATRLEVLCVGSPDILPMVESGRADIGIRFSDTYFDQSVDLCFVGTVAFWPVCGPEHPLALLENVEVSHASMHRQLVLQGENERGLDMVPAIASQVWSSNNVQCIVSLLEKNIGWAYLPVSVVESSVAEKTLARIDMRLDDKPWVAQMDLVTPKNRPVGPAMKWLSDALVGVLE